MLSTSSRTLSQHTPSRAKLFQPIFPAYPRLSRTSALAAIHNPNLFSLLILIDPVITKSLWPDDPHPGLTHASFCWLLSVAEMDGPQGVRSTSLFQKKPFFSARDLSLLRVCVECGLYHSSSQPTIRLKIPSIYNSVIFDAERTSVEAFANMSRLDYRIKLRWIIPGIDNPEEYIDLDFVFSLGH
ncbi:hypothetical protein AX14_006702 [Amanita brunnescens Koide BX004]|nr:hypothetical protein AX14_006702 [Amanita brunnescens Koide BX004]